MWQPSLQLKSPFLWPMLSICSSSESNVPPTKNGNFYSWSSVLPPSFIIHNQPQAGTQAHRAARGCSRPQEVEMYTFGLSSSFFHSTTEKCNIGCVPLHEYILMSV